MSQWPKEPQLEPMETRMAKIRDKKEKMDLNKMAMKLPHKIVEAHKIALKLMERTCRQVSPRVKEIDPSFSLLLPVLWSHKMKRNLILYPAYLKKMCCTII